MYSSWVASKPSGKKAFHRRDRLEEEGDDKTFKEKGKGVASCNEIHFPRFHSVYMVYM